MRVGTKWLVVVFVGFLVMAWTAGPVMAGEKIKFRSKRIGVTHDQTTHPVGDAKGHVMGVSISEGFDLTSNATFRNVNIFDVRLPQGVFFSGWSVATYPDGDQNFGSFQGKIVFKPTKDGKVQRLLQGTMKITGGTGKWAGATGLSTFKGVYLSRTVWMLEIEGEYTLKKK